MQIMVVIVIQADLNEFAAGRLPKTQLHRQLENAVAETARNHAGRMTFARASRCDFAVCRAEHGEASFNRLTTEESCHEVSLPRSFAGRRDRADRACGLVGRLRTGPAARAARPCAGGAAP